MSSAGGDGDDGKSTIIVHQRSEDIPAVPTGTYTVADGLTLEGGWEQAIPVSIGGDEDSTIALHANNDRATGLAIYENQKYVSNDGFTTSSKFFFIYNAQNVSIAEYSLHADNQDPQAITVTPDGRVLVADGDDVAVFEYETDGTYVARHALPSGTLITGMDSDATRIYLLNSSAKRVLIYNHSFASQGHRNLPITGSHAFKGYVFAHGRDYVLNSYRLDP